MMETQIVGIAAGCFTGVSLLPQLIKMVKEKSSQDISIVMLVCLLIGLCLWIIYGIMKEDWPIILTNAFSLLVNCCIIILNSVYKKSGK
ncbi:MAG TPA: SemiSWEET transporter [Daejeonella sp.]